MILTQARAHSAWTLPIRILIATAVLVVASKITVPTVPVPVTLQTLAVVLIALIGGRAVGLGAVLAFIGIGAAGAPVFANAGSGVAYLVGPTAGYLAGFVASALVVGWLADRGARADGWRTAVAVLLGVIAIYLPGVSYLATQIGTERALQFGLLPFLLPEALKVALALAVMAAYRMRLRRQSA